ncbi:MAG: hypothetical protein GXP54_02530 [Deltaproteobacteria bacterium]|nr:hypothetical protein [Deltaproteobacteria bacterium]
MSDPGIVSTTPSPAPPTILATHEDTNANAALLKGGEILAAVAEERLTRRKFQPGNPVLAIEEVLRQGGLALEQVDEWRATAIISCPGSWERHQWKVSMTCSARRTRHG